MKRYRAASIKVLRFLLCSLLSIAVVLFMTLLIVVMVLPKPILTLNKQSTAYFDDQGTLLRYTLADDDRYRTHIQFEQLPQSLIDATLIYEDKHFYNHAGVDIRAIMRATFTTYIAKKRAIGASTITMQVARLHANLYTKSIAGKLYQILYALRLDYHYNKQALLTYYFNAVSYGGNIEGIYAASLIYFNKAPHQLNPLEAVSLSVIPQNPNKRNPTSEKGLKALYRARNILIDKLMVQKKYKQLVQYKDLPLNVYNTGNLPFLAPHFIEYVKSIYAQKNQSAAYTTSLHLPLQKKIETHVKRYIQNKKQIGIENTAVTVLNYKTMQIKSMVGSADFFNQAILGQVNGTTAKRSPGSTLKPFVYAAALQEGLIHPLTLLKDTRQRYAGFSPNNHDSLFKGALSAQDALITSRNVPAVYLQSQLNTQVKTHYFYDLLKQAGISNMRPAHFYGLALSLGGIEVSMLELVKLYAMLANNGCKYEINVLQRLPLAPCQPLISQAASYITLHMLRKTSPIATPSYLASTSYEKQKIAWKTGTSWAYRDAWAVAIYNDYIVAVWVGNFNGKGNPAFIGRKAAAPLLFNVLNALPELTSSATNKPNSVKTIDVCESTGNIDTTFCPKTASTLFIAGVSPIKSLNVYRQIHIDKTTGLRACAPFLNNTEKKIFAFWPSDIANLKHNAGQNIKPIPKYMPFCKNSTHQQGNAPNITSPEKNITYIHTQHENIIFNASADKDASKLYWFVNNQFWYQSTPSQIVTWPTKIGHHSVSVVDDLGRTATQMFTVSRY